MNVYTTLFAMHSSSHRLQSKFATVVVVLMPVTLWLLLRGYHGLLGDGQIYAFQALSRIHTQFAADLYLQNTSQDQFTIFSPIYAWFISWFGLEQAARLLTLVFTLWFLIAAWSIAHTLAGRDAAWLAVCLLLVVAGSYGGSGVFRFSDQFLTARLPAEAMIVTSLALFVRGRRWPSFAIATVALFFHPLVALPGLLLLICLWVPNQAASAGAVLGVLLTLAVAIASTAIPSLTPALPLMDVSWLDTVRERSQFLFLQLWTYRDWELNVRPFFYLAFTAVAIQEIRIRKICYASALIGAAGLAIALVAGLIGPVALFVQGQAWRWEWITVFIAAVLLPVTAMRVWRDEKCGPLCAILLILGWTLSAVDGTACVSLAIAVWVMRGGVSARHAIFIRWVSVALACAIVGWIIMQTSHILGWSAKTSAFSWRLALPSVTEIRSIFDLRISAVLLVALIFWWLRQNRSPWQPILLAAVLLASSIALLPSAFKQSRLFGTPADIDEFTDWRRAIPSTSTVLVVPARDVGSFVWFTLQRPNYLTVDQSAGVVFSRATALEVRRRSDVLLPVMEPNWKIRTHLHDGTANTHKAPAVTRPLTTDSLQQICNDPVLGFVISSRDVGFEPLRHVSAGSWKDWNLYDCRKVRQSSPNS
jgi:hypothetical protein